MPRHRLEERDLRSLERRSMYSIFRALDPTERPLRPLRPMLMRLSIPSVDEFSWKFVLGLLWMPVLLGLVELELWLQIPQAVAWLLVIAFCVAYGLMVVLALRKL